MRNRISKILAIALTLALVFGVAAMPVSAEPLPEIIYVGGVEMNNGDYLANGAAETTAEAPSEGGYACYKDGVLTLNNYVYSGEGYTYYSYESTETPESSYSYTSVIYSPLSLKIELVGDSFITNTAAESDGITPGGRLEIDGKGSLAITAEYGIYADIINTETVEIVINGGILNFVSGYNAVYLCGNDGDALLTVNGGSITCDSDYGLAVESNAENGSAQIVINGGEVINSGSEGLYAYSYQGTSEITVNGGRVSVTGEYHSVFADKISINGGIVDAEASAGTAINGELVLGDDVVITGESQDGLSLSTHFTYYAGDANGDKIIDLYDCLMIKSIYFGRVDYSYEEFLRSDVTFDGLIDMYDYLAVKSAYFSGDEPTLLPDAYAPDPLPGTETAYTKLYNYILANGTVSADNENYYSLSSEPVYDYSANPLVAMIGVYTDDASYIEIGGVKSSADGTEMIVTALAITETTTQYEVMTLYLVDGNVSAMGMGTVTAGGCVDGVINIENLEGTGSETMSLTDLEALSE